MDIFVNNLSSNQDTRVIQVANPMFSAMANQLVALYMTSHGRHIGFQDGSQLIGHTKKLVVSRQN